MSKRNMCYSESYRARWDCHKHEPTPSTSFVADDSRGITIRPGRRCPSCDCSSGGLGTPAATPWAGARRLSGCRMPPVLRGRRPASGLQRGAGLSTVGQVRITRVSNHTRAPDTHRRPRPTGCLWPICQTGLDTDRRHLHLVAWGSWDKSQAQTCDEHPHALTPAL